MGENFSYASMAGTPRGRSQVSGLGEPPWSAASEFSRERLVDFFGGRPRSMMEMELSEALRPCGEIGDDSNLTVIAVGDLRSLMLTGEVTIEAPPTTGVATAEMG